MSICKIEASLITPNKTPSSLPKQGWNDHVKVVKTTSLKDSSHNARTHSKKQIKQIANSVLRFGWVYPLLVDEHSTIIAGHGRHLAAIELGLTEVPIHVLTGLDDAEKRALMLADNKIAANAGWDREILARELGELSVLLPEIDLDIDITGFASAEIDTLLGDLIEPEADPADIPPEPAKEATSRRGDLWILGNHRLLCGDACLEIDIRKLMGGVRAAMVFADVPYNLAIKSIVGRGKTKHREFAAASGEMSAQQFIEFNAGWMSLAARFSHDGSIHFTCIDWRHLGEVLQAGHNVYGPPKNLAVWVKTNAGQGSFYRSQHELIFVFKNGDAPHRNNIELGKHGRNRSNIWNYPGSNSFRAGRMDDLSVHPTVKPVAMVVDAMRDCTRRGDVVLDPFIGSGTTILAAERVGRRGYGLEIDPLYIDVGIRRWQSFTGKDAVLAKTGQTFDEVAAARRSEGPESAPPSQKEPSRHRRGPKPVPATPARLPSSVSVPLKGGRNEYRR
jgi:DNA modification methylase